MKQVRARDFVSNELRVASRYFNQRTLPHLMDGLKPGQRKVISAAIDLPNNDEIKVSSLGAKAVDKKAYHHGDAALQETIVKMAQRFPGTNNVSLLAPLGTFGTAKVKEGSAPRYIFTKLTSEFWNLFKKSDLSIVNPQYDDGDEIEPQFYIPMLPTLLINGAEGTGTGYKSSILLYNPKDLKRAIGEIAKTGAVKTPLTPWMNGWKGRVVKDFATGQAVFYGVAEVVNKTKVMITEVPYSRDLESLKVHLNGLMDKGIIKDYTNRSGIGDWKIEVQVPREFTDKKTQDQILETLGLIKRVTETIVCWGVNGELLVFNSVEDLLVKWYEERVKLAGKSLSNIIAEEEEQLIWYRIKRLFLAWWRDNAEEAVKLTKQEIEKRIVNEVHLLKQHPKYMTRILETKVFNLAKDETEMLTNHIVNCEKEITRLGGFSPATWYQTNLEGVGVA